MSNSHSTYKMIQFINFPVTFSFLPEDTYQAHTAEEFPGKILNHSLRGFTQQLFSVTTSVLFMDKRVNLLNSYFENKSPQESILIVNLIFCLTLFPIWEITFEAEHDENERSTKKGSGLQWLVNRSNSGNCLKL